MVMYALKKFTVFPKKHIKEDNEPKCFNKSSSCVNINKKCKDCMMIQGRWTNYESA